jgi:hypothetical protein
MTIEWSSILTVFLVSVVGSAVTVALFATGIKLLAVPPADSGAATAPARDDETDDVSSPTRPRAATAGGVVFFVLSGMVVVYGIYLIVPALHGG